MTIKPVSGFDFMGKVYSTREAAEHAQKLHYYSAALREAIEYLGQQLHELHERNANGYEPFKGMAEEMFPEYGEQRPRVMEALELARDAYADFKAAK